MMLVGEDKHANFSQNLSKLVENGRKVDNTFIINPVIEGDGEDWTEPLDIPLNLMELTQNVKISGDAHCFNMKKLWGITRRRGRMKTSSRI